MLQSPNSLARLLAFSTSVPLGMMLLLATGCPPPANPDGGVDAGDVDGGDDPVDGGDDPVDGGGGDIDGDSCDNPITVVGGATVEETTVGATDDHAGSCGGDGAPDKVFKLVIAEDSGVTIAVNGFDSVVYLAKGGCDAADEVEGACTDVGGDSEALNIALLPAGEYNLVVDGFNPGDGTPPTEGAFTLSVEVTPGGICVGDQFDADGANDVASGAINAGAADIDTIDLDPATDGDQGVTLTLCEGDVDYFVFGHMGGNLEATLEDVSGDGNLAGEIFAAVVDEEASGAAGATVFKEGDKLGDTDFDGTASRGNYLLKVTAGGLDQLGLNYAFALNHACDADSSDNPDVTLDDEVNAESRVVLSESTEEPVTRTICATDKDVFEIQNLIAGDVILDFGGAVIGGQELGIQIELFNPNAGENEDATTDVAAQKVVNGNDLTLTIPNAAAGRYLVTISGGAANPQDTAAYDLAVTFAALANPPANDKCEASEELVFGGADIVGRTLTGTNDVAGACNADEDAAAGGFEGAPEVFYSLTLDQANNVEFNFDGTASEFTGALYLLKFEDSCPADLNTLERVEINDAPLCKTGDVIRLRAANLEAGDYLLVVDGVFIDFFGLFQDTTRGVFTLNAKLFPDGFPAPTVCTTAAALDVPAAGQSANVTVNNVELSNEIDAYGECSQGGTGNEQVFTITPAANTSITISTEGYDTVLALREGDCENGAEVACNDDIDVNAQNFNSSITADLVAGTTYFLIVDAFGSDAAGETVLTISAE